MAIKSEKTEYKKNGGKREGAGRPKFVPTEQEKKQVLALIGFGIQQAQIARLIRDGIDKDVFARAFRNEIDTGYVVANAKVAESLFNKATKGGDTTAMIWWTKARMKWTDREEQQHQTALPSIVINMPNNGNQSNNTTS